MNDPKLVREIMANKFGHFQKRKHTGIVKRLSNGLVNHEGEKWAAHRKIINPAFLSHREAQGHYFHKYQ